MEGDVRISSRLPVHLISTHALRMEGDVEGSRFWFNCNPISTHALRMEGDLSLSCYNKVRKISTHALRMEGDEFDIISEMH